MFAAGALAGVQFERSRDAPPKSTETPKPIEPAVSARVYNPRKPARILPAPVPEIPVETAEEFENLRKLQPELVRSRAVLIAALRPAEIAQLPAVRAQDDPVAWLSETLRIDFVTSEIMWIGLDGDDANELRMVVDSVVNTYLQRNAYKEGTERTGRIRRLKEASEELRGSIRGMRNSVAMLQHEAGGGPEVMAQNLLECRREIRRIRLLACHYSIAG